MKENIIIHQNIEEKLDYFIKNQKIPNILFHGPSGSGKRTLILKFIDNLIIIIYRIYIFISQILIY